MTPTWRMMREPDDSLTIEHVDGLVLRATVADSHRFEDLIEAAVEALNAAKDQP